jgi:hypothetical protein
LEENLKGGDTKDTTQQTEVSLSPNFNLCVSERKQHVGQELRLTQQPSKAVAPISTLATLILKHSDAFF